VDLAGSRSGSYETVPWSQREVTVAKTVAQKARVKPGTTIAVVNRVPRIVESLGLPKDVTLVNPTNAQLVFLFGCREVGHAAAGTSQHRRHLVGVPTAPRTLNRPPPRFALRRASAQHCDASSQTRGYVV
jgi:hypothetical protein